MNETLRTLSFIGIKIKKYFFNVENNKYFPKRYGYFTPHL